MAAEIAPLWLEYTKKVRAFGHAEPDVFFRESMQLPPNTDDATRAVRRKQAPSSAAFAAACLEGGSLGGEGGEGGGPGGGGKGGGLDMGGEGGGGEGGGMTCPLISDSVPRISPGSPPDLRQCPPRAARAGHVALRDVRLRLRRC